MKTKVIVFSLLLGLSVSAYASNEDVSGTYTTPNEKNLTINKNGEKYVVSTRIKVKSMHSNRETLGPYKVVTYKKDNSLLLLSDDSVVGTINDDEFTLNKNGKVYKKKL
ncbi:hypothetical protein [Haemophilus haemolyticus]|jgi:hypothetical protein|uniref:hypothetical protein n=1 Tax=Haemophilus haemolyticus TaxID=726 RepID=UPI000E573370|nr:hypothetical protein [Haemophilus haemolyticus]